MREPAAAGYFYPGKRRSLESSIEDCFKRGPGPIRGKGSGGKGVFGVVSPHAGYPYSGSVAAFGFRALEEGGLPRTVVIVGPNHGGWGSPAGKSLEDWKTPLGVIECDRELADRIDIEVDENAHGSEHSLEVQVPFIQSLDPGIKMVGIQMTDQSLASAKELGRKMARALDGYGRKVALVASSDFTHCGSSYGVPVPTGMDPGQYAKSIDIPLIKELLRMDLESAYEVKKRLGVTACGLGPIAAMMTAAREAGKVDVELLKYATSYDVSPSSAAVGYASIVVR